MDLTITFTSITWGRNSINGPLTDCYINGTLDDGTPVTITVPAETIKQELEQAFNKSTQQS